MNNIKSFDNEIINEWLKFREEKICSITNEDDKEYHICFEKISSEILKLVPGESKVLAHKQFDSLNNNMLDYLNYWNHKYYKYGFYDSINIIYGLLK